MIIQNTADVGSRKPEPTVEATTEEASEAVSKAARKLIPLLALMYFVAFLDRVNVSFAALTMNADIGLSATAYGFGAGIFFLGYVVFEVPSNLIMEKVGARRWIARIMISWGALAMAMAFVTGPISFWILRFLLGVAEAGFFPGILLYLTYWFPSAVRGRIIGSFLVAVPISSALGAPLSTALLGVEIFGLRGWQSMFILEAIPAVLLGIGTLFWLPDRPADAKFLSTAEKATLEALVARDQQSTGAHTLREGLLNLDVWRFALVYAGLVIGLYGFSFWAPQIIKGLGELSNLQVGFASVAPFSLSAVAMWYWGRRSDRKKERLGHLVAPTLLAAVAFGLSSTVGDPLTIFILLLVGIVGINAALPVFWTTPTSLLGGTAAAGGIALINSVGNVGGYVGPFFIGYIKDATGAYGPAMLLLSLCLLGAAGLAWSMKARSVQATNQPGVT